MTDRVGKAKSQAKLPSPLDLFRLRPLMEHWLDKQAGDTLENQPTAEKQGGLFGGTSLKVMGKRKREKNPVSLNFIRLSFSNCLNHVFNYDDLLYIYLQQFNTAFDSNVG